MEAINFVFLSIVVVNIVYHVWSLSGLFWNLVLVGVVYLGVRQWLVYRVKKIEGQGRGVVITGCDTGIGHESAVRLDRLGFTVFACCLFPDAEGAEDLRRRASKRFHVVSMDVTDQKSIDEAVEYVTKHCPSKDILAVVNNAAINIVGDIELATLDMYKKVAEVNQFGVIRVTRAFAPLIRKSKGRFINVTSVKGRIAGCLDSTYTITKWAGEAFSDTLRREMKRFGVKVVIMEPGDFGGLTGMLNKETIAKMEQSLNLAWDSASDNVKNAYGRTYVDALIRGIHGAGTTCHSTLEPVLAAMEDAVTNENPKYRYLVDGSASRIDKFCFFARLNPILPEAWMDFLLPLFFPVPAVKAGTS